MTKIGQSYYQQGRQINLFTPERSAQNHRVLTELCQYTPFRNLIQNLINPDQIIGAAATLHRNQLILEVYGQNLISIEVPATQDPFITKAAQFLLGTIQEPPTFPRQVQKKTSHKVRFDSKVEVIPPAPTHQKHTPTPEKMRGNRPEPADEKTFVVNAPQELHTNHVDDLIRENRRISTELDQVQERFRAYQEEVQGVARSGFETLHKTEDELRAAQLEAERLRPFEASAQELNQRIQASSAERSELENHVNQLNEQLQKLAADRDQLSQQAQASSAERAGLENHINQLNEQLQKLVADRDQLSEQAQASSAERVGLENHINQLNEQLQKLAADRDQLSEQAQASSAKRAGLENHINQLNEQLQKLAADRDQLSQQIQSKGGELEARTHTLSRAEEEIHKLHQERMTQNGEISRLKKDIYDLSTLRDQLNKDLRTNAAEPDRLRAEINKQANTINQLRQAAANAELPKKKAALEKQIQTLTEQRQKLEADMAAQNGQRQEKEAMEKRIAELSDELRFRQEQVNKQSEALESAQNAAQQSKDHIATLLNQGVEQNRQILEIQGTLRNALTHRTKLSKDLQKSRIEKEALQKEFSELRDSTMLIEDYRARNEMLSRQLAEKDAEIHRLQTLLVRNVVRNRFSPLFWAQPQRQIASLEEQIRPFAPFPPLWNSPLRSTLKKQEEPARAERQQLTTPPIRLVRPSLIPLRMQRLLQAVQRLRELTNLPRN